MGDKTPGKAKKKKKPDVKNTGRPTQPDAAPEKKRKK
jgi:hypothetical protein